MRRQAGVDLRVGTLRPLQAQPTQPTAPPDPPAVDRLVRVSGAFHPADGPAAAPGETVIVTIYAQAEGGTPLWHERQDVAVEDEGGTRAFPAPADPGRPVSRRPARRGLGIATHQSAGRSALKANVSGVANTALGSGALALTTGSSNIGIGNGGG